jgi:hypothetical protein
MRYRPHHRCKAAGTVCLCRRERFVSAAACSQPVSYQWQSNGIPITGATNESLNFASAQPADQASYRVLVQRLLLDHSQVLASSSGRNRNFWSIAHRYIR